MSQASKLFRLQQIDRQLDITNIRLREIEKALGDTSELEKAEMHHGKKEDLLRQERKKLQLAEDDVKRQQEKIKQTELTLYGGTVRNPKELQDLQKEAAALKRYLSVLEDRQLEAMLSVEDAEVDLAESTVILESTRIKVDKKFAQLKEERASLSSNVNRLEIERLAAVNDITVDELDLYEQMRRQKGGVAVVQITDKACAACGSTLTAALIQSAHSPSQIARCSSCGRLLYPG